MMSNRTLLLKGGQLVDPEANEVYFADVAIADGKISSISAPGTLSIFDEMIDISGLYIAPGFVDSHIHDAALPFGGEVQRALLKQGVTTAIAGHCGDGPCLSAPARQEGEKPWIKVGYMVGHNSLREEVGCADRYAPATPEQIERMIPLLAQELNAGAMGLSFGLEYAPGSSAEEINAVAARVAQSKDRVISIHIRDDGIYCAPAVAEAIKIAQDHGVSVQISHLGSMTAFGVSQSCVAMIEDARRGGAPVFFDCYPYTAFCTSSATAVFDDGFETRWGGKGCSCLQAASGKFKGERLTKDSLAWMRENEPEGLIIAHVMNEEEVLFCLKHADGIVASDSLYRKGGAHPRLSGTFPRALRLLTAAGLSWPEAVKKMTILPSQVFKLESGRIAAGVAADLVIFDPKTLKDCATFEDPLAAPEGIHFVFIDGQMVLKEGEILTEPAGAMLYR